MRVGFWHRTDLRSVRQRPRVERARLVLDAVGHNPHLTRHSRAAPNPYCLLGCDRSVGLVPRPARRIESWGEFRQIHPVSASTLASYRGTNTRHTNSKDAVQQPSSISRNSSWSDAHANEQVDHAQHRSPGGGSRNCVRSRQRLADGYQRRGLLRLRAVPTSAVSTLVVTSAGRC